MNLKSLKPGVQPILTFRKWHRKNYSVFQTLHKIVNISVLAVAYLVSVPLVSIASDNDTTEVKMEYNLDEIEISAQRAPAMVSQVARFITVIENKEIESAPVQSVQELLEYIAGVDVRQRGSEGVQADISIRGGTFDQMLILLNGINITDPQTGHHNLNLPVSLSQIERIEVLEGPAAGVYGPNAFSGAINIVTNEALAKFVKLDIGTGNFHLFNTDIAGSFSLGKLRNLLSFERKSSEGYIENTDFGISNFYYNNSLDNQNGKFSFQVGISDKNFGANSFYTPKYPNQFEQTKTLFTSVKWQSSSKFHLTPVIYYRRHQDRFELFRENPPSWYTTHNYHLTNVYGSNLNSWIEWNLGKSAFGAEFRSENILSNVLGESITTPKKVPGEDAFFIKSKSRDIYSLFIEHSYYGRNWTFSAGFMSNYISEKKLGWNIFPGFESSFNILPQFKIYGSYNTSLRMPTFTDLYYSGPTNVGNPDLNPERSSAWEGGFKWSSELLKGYWAIYYREGKNIIDWVKLTNEEKWKPQNLTRVNSLGTEIMVEMNLRKYLSKKLPDQILLSFFHNNLKKEANDFISNYVLDNIKNKLTGSVTQQVTKNITVDLKIVYQERAGTYTQFLEDNWGNEIAYDPFWLFDSKMTYNMQNFKFFLSVNNIFNTSYFDIGNVVQPGRWIKTGISYQLNFK